MHSENAAPQRLSNTLHNTPVSWASEVAEQVNDRLVALFDEKLADAQRCSPRAHELVEAVAALTMRGGKRLRPLAMYAGYRATAAPGARTDWDAVAALGASIELLQSYLLIQDDWMDDDLERRGGPSTHAALSRQYNDVKLGASLAMLAGDVAMGFAIELLHTTRFPARRMHEAFATYMNVHFEVVCGQQLDLLGHEDVALVHNLKTGSYTVRGPITLGALLGNASDHQLQAIAPFAGPLGLAFQLRDDLLGTFGDSQTTGKPTGRDLRQGKKTALVAAARARMSAAERELLDNVLGNPDAASDAVEALKYAMQRCGARLHVETELDQHLSAARSALTSSTALMPEGVAMLLELTDRMALRDR
jgi:geranylgeranyl diphosphate synthase type I